MSDQKSNYRNGLFASGNPMRLAVLLSGVVIFILFVVYFQIFKQSNPADDVLSKLGPTNSKIVPEMIDTSDWVFWCTGGDPGMLSGGTEFTSAQEFARKYGLAYVGPNKKTSETYEYNLVFVRADGSYSEKKVSRYWFVWDSSSDACWKRSASEIVFLGQNILRVEMMHG